MTKSQTALKAVAAGLIAMFSNFAAALTGKGKESQERRTVKGRELYKRALDPSDDGVRFWYQRKDGVLKARLRVVSTSEVHAKTGDPIKRWAEIAEDGTHKCSCPDHKERGAFCKHLRALSGLTVKRTGRR
jgi:hypothetical protein